jgi:hypothetical protein
MKSRIFLFSFLLMSYYSCRSQVYVNLTDNLAIGSNSNIKITGGYYNIQDTGLDA